jgi:hypothetical protein
MEFSPVKFASSLMFSGGLKNGGFARSNSERTGNAQCRRNLGYERSDLHDQEISGMPTIREGIRGIVAPKRSDCLLFPANIVPIFSFSIPSSDPKLEFVVRLVCARSPCTKRKSHQLESPPFFNFARPYSLAPPEKLCDCRCRDLSNFITDDNPDGDSIEIPGHDSFLAIFVRIAVKTWCDEVSV